jgi:hypothetical protein
LARAKIRTFATAVWRWRADIDGLEIAWTLSLPGRATPYFDGIMIEMALPFAL